LAKKPQWNFFSQTLWRKNRNGIFCPKLFGEKTAMEFFVPNTLAKKTPTEFFSPKNSREKKCAIFSPGKYLLKK
jgi:hypothetical protein